MGIKVSVSAYGMVRVLYFCIIGKIMDYFNIFPI